MANPYYTASPMVNFQYETKPSEAQGVLDTMKKIKKEGIEDETRQMQMLQAQQAYEMGNLKMQGAQMEMDEVKRMEEIEQQSSQIYKSQLAAGVPRSQAMKSVTDYRQANLPWSKRQADLDEMKKSSLEALKFADRVPPEALADAAAQFSISFGVEVTPEQFQQMSKNRQPVTTKDGRIYEWDNAQGDYVEKTPAALAKRLDEETQIERQTEERKLKMEDRRIAISEGNLGQSQREFNYRQSQDKLESELKAKDIESRIAERTAKVEKMKAEPEKLVGEDLLDYKNAQKRVEALKKQIDRAENPQTVGKEDFRVALIRSLGKTPSGNEEIDKTAVQEWAEEKKNELRQILQTRLQEGRPGAESLYRNYNPDVPGMSAPVANPAANPAGVATGTKTLGPSSKYGLALQNAKKRQTTGGK